MGKSATAVASDASAAAGDGERDVTPLAGVRGQGRGIWAAPSCAGWEEPARRQGLPGLAAAGLLADGLLSGPPRGQLYGFAH